MSTITDIDFKILNLIQEYFSCSFLNFLMPKITFLGNGGLIWIVMAIIMLFWAKYRKTGIMVGVGLLEGVIIGNILLKNLIARERPCWINETVNILISIPQDYSFPSGHTLSSFIAATIIMHTDKRMGIAAYMLASMIAFSRLYLYVHFPTDVLAGALLGIIIGIVSSVISDKIFSSVEKRTSQ
ncbi:phosphatase PAP2 family protein [Ruminococcus sp.]|uniref:phosphatase PAP2 family protein n=1 Tax=Ruminococcus sp. TaxID=41978 RepID=UPI0025CC540D|nr:phosphatase PAP2 family protein [Ruminococcus sp.]